MSTTDTNLEIDNDSGLPQPATAEPGTAELWTRRAPRSLAKRYRRIEDADGWQHWCDYLPSRRNPPAIRKLFPGRRSPLLWAMPAEPAGSATAELVERLNDLARRPSDAASQGGLATEVENWLWSSDAAERSAPWALETLAWAQALPWLVGPLGAGTWWRLVERLIALVQEGGRTDVLTEPLVNQILAGELPLTLVYQFPELTICRQLQTSARIALARGMTEILDGEGLPQGGYFPILRPLLACWTRCRAIGGKTTWDRESEKQFRLLALEAIRLSRTDGTQVLSQGEACTRTPKLLELALQLIHRKPLSKTAARMLPSLKIRGTSSGRIKAAPAVNSEWAEVAVLQPAWRRSGPKLSLVYAERRVQIELEYRAERIWSGNWDLELALDGTPVEIAANWEEVCWMSDDDVDYLEIEARLTGGLTVQRQVLLARKDRCLLLADAIVAARPARIEYRSSLPLAAAIEVEAAAETREVWLAGRRARLAALPLALPEWRADPRHGELVERDGKLCLRQSADAQRLYAPLLLDIDPRRAAQGLTWRQLTVAESRQIQPANVAVGYRAQAGKTQWMLYRSLAATGIRTVLGQNLSTEFLFGRFRRNGEVDRMVEIE